MTLTLTFSEVTKLKDEIQKHFSVNVHFHDGCGGQYFSLDDKNEEVSKYIFEYFKKLNLKATFSNDGLQFTVDN
jgi:hypothetical protein